MPIGSLAVYKYFTEYNFAPRLQVIQKKNYHTICIFLQNILRQTNIISSCCLLCLFYSVLLQSTPAFSDTLGDLLHNKLEQELGNKFYSKVSVGISIKNIDGELLYAHNQNKLYIPGSILKIFTSGAALKILGSEHRIITPLKTDGELQSGILHGNIYLIGKGDPTLTRANLDMAANSLQLVGIGKIQGDLIYDNSYFIEEENPYAPNARHLYVQPSALIIDYGWIIPKMKINGQKGYIELQPKTAYARLTQNIQINNKSNSPGKAALVYQQEEWGDHFFVKGVITGWDIRYRYIRFGVSRPALYSATLFKEALKKHDITLEGSIRSGKAPQHSKTLYTIQGKNIQETLKELNHNSNNLIAEEIGLYLGAQRFGAPGNKAKGLKAVKKFLEQEAGLTSTFKITDFAGLSASNRISAEQLTQVLHYLRSNPDTGNTFIDLLPQQGKHPFSMNPAPPPGVIMHTKSGTLPESGVNAVTGYVIIPEKNREFSFTIIVNRVRGNYKTYSGTYTTPLLKALNAACTEYLEQP